MNIRTHELSIDEKIKRKYFRLAVFKGKGGSQTSTTTRNIPAQTANEATLENGLMGYNTTGLNNASNVLNNGVNSIDSTYNPDWSFLSNNYNKTMNNVSNGFSDLTNGNLPSTYAAARQQALNSDLNSTVGSAISGLANRGILNSSVTNNALNNISQNASDSLAKSYSSDLSTYANLLSQQSNNASNTLSGNATAQQSSYYEPTSLLSYASQLATPSQNMYNTMYSGRMGTSGTTQTQSSNNGKGNTLQAAAQIASAYYGAQ